jgi:hypothetical protein
MGSRPHVRASSRVAAPPPRPRRRGRSSRRRDPWLRPPHRHRSRPRRPHQPRAPPPPPSAQLPPPRPLHRPSQPPPPRMRRVRHRPRPPAVPRVPPLVRRAGRSHRRPPHVRRSARAAVPSHHRPDPAPVDRGDRRRRVPRGPRGAPTHSGRVAVRRRPARPGDRGDSGLAPGEAGSPAVPVADLRQEAVPAGAGDPAGVARPSVGRVDAVAISKSLSQRSSRRTRRRTPRFPRERSSSSAGRRRATSGRSSTVRPATSSASCSSKGRWSRRPSRSPTT